MFVLGTSQFLISINCKKWSQMVLKRVSQLSQQEELRCVGFADLYSTFHMTKSGLLQIVKIINCCKGKPKITLWHTVYTTAREISSSNKMDLS